MHERPKEVIWGLEGKMSPFQETTAYISDWEAVFDSYRIDNEKMKDERNEQWRWRAREENQSW